MVEILERRGDAEWSPDMELEGCDAEKAAALLLAVAPRCRSSSDTTKGDHEKSPRMDYSSGPTEMANAKDDDHAATVTNSSSSEIGEGSTTPPSCVPVPVPVSGSPRVRRLHVPSSPSSTSAFRPSTTSSPVRPPGAPNMSGETGNVAYAWEDGDHEVADRHNRHDRRVGVGYPTSAGMRPAPVHHDYREGDLDDDDTMGMVEPKVEMQHGYRRSGTSHPVSPRSTLPHGIVGREARSPRGNGASSGPCMLLSLAEFATKELMTMDEDDPNYRREQQMSSPPLRPRPSIRPGGYDSSYPLPRLSPRSSLAVAALSEAADSAGPPRSHGHGHHLRERIGTRNRSAHRSRLHYNEEIEDEHDDDRSGMFARGMRGGGRRRNRPRSLSMPEGMDLQAKRVMDGPHPSAIRYGSRIEAIKEEFDGYDAGPSVRSRAWRGGGVEPGVPTSSRDRGYNNDVVFGSVEDAKALIGLGRPPDKWHSHVEDEDEDEEDEDDDDDEELHSSTRGEARGVDGDEDGVGLSRDREGDGEADGEGICVSLPHMLAKYADMYNKNGRIGIYTRQEREAIIERFKRKRLRRVWKKKIRYNCRKNLADKRLRVKGRFVKMSAEQRTALKLKQKSMRGSRAGGATGGGAASRTESSTSAGSMDMDLLAGEDISSETGSGGSGSGGNGEAFEDEHGEQDGARDQQDEELDEEDEDLDDEGGNDAYPQEPPKRVRRHSIAY